MTIKIRQAHPGDTTALTDIMHRSKAYWGYDDDKMGGFRSAFRICQSDISAYDMLIAERNGKPVGFAGGRLGTAEEAQVYQIVYLFIAPEGIKQGLGLLLLTRLSDLARAGGATLLRLESDHFAVDFYQHNGFQPVDSRPSKMAPTGKIPVLEKAIPTSIVPLQDIKLKLDRGTSWCFETENHAAIESHWQDALRHNPHLWNGRTLKLSGHSFKDGVFEGTCMECSFAAFLTWRDWGAPDLTAFNLFGSAILRSSDGALLYGVMSDKTANAGKVYPPGGNLDPSDVLADGTVDVYGAIFRELEEETGLSRSDVSPGERFAVFDGPRISIAQVLDVDKPAEDLARDIVAFSLASEEQELADIRILRNQGDLYSPDLVSYARALARHLLPI
ncbi:GNAT family N-acetyltransferase [Labrenzia sp. CE80]|uniref:GNAT family N-acetyltransferase n=1 Tax=Labrenzia sp. CE80 TaxID=1788986 RepID=UPI00129ADF15|nr:GNAT family N-acetyltransferase [Labrenzia sp. CE80]